MASGGLPTAVTAVDNIARDDRQNKKSKWDKVLTCLCSSIRNKISVTSIYLLSLFHLTSRWIVMEEILFLLERKILYLLLEHIQFFYQLLMLELGTQLLRKSFTFMHYHLD